MNEMCISAIIYIGKAAIDPPSGGVSVKYLRAPGAQGK